jgi:hypothetical protein
LAVAVLGPVAVGDPDFGRGALEEVGDVPGANSRARGLYAGIEL